MFPSAERHSARHRTAMFRPVHVLFQPSPESGRHGMMSGGERDGERFAVFAEDVAARGKALGSLRRPLRQRVGVLGSGLYEGSVASLRRLKQRGQKRTQSRYVVRTLGDIFVLVVVGARWVATRPRASPLNAPSMWPVCVPALRKPAWQPGNIHQTLAFVGGGAPNHLQSPFGRCVLPSKTYAAYDFLQPALKIGHIQPTNVDASQTFDRLALRPRGVGIYFL
ncbi:hypothetical protein BU26DRAFT_178276 [Trematosphaeria pertusa]|uniref:Uncharacterized protein n=1 Tax=Trematosphaeria pertusa TaxID=390896 RepID=A0A6A6HV57_9PLEO|nr:uncharacterized protein BU26DRAFT_178276 [Trematosphaeria pertusa]KAF2241443.1 hypothetical protein BU26DRAFT_178276 [Trematosphaeria pertusa]